MFKTNDFLLSLIFFTLFLQKIKFTCLQPLDLFRRPQQSYRDLHPTTFEFTDTLQHSYRSRHPVNDSSPSKYGL